MRVVIHPAHIIGGALADPQVDGMNRGHIAHCDSAASKHCAYSIHQQTASQQYHENHLAQQQHKFQINDQPMQQPLEPDDQQQQSLKFNKTLRWLRIISSSTLGRLKMESWRNRD